MFKGGEFQDFSCPTLACCSRQRPTGAIGLNMFKGSGVSETKWLPTGAIGLSIIKGSRVSDTSLAPPKLIVVGHRRLGR